MSALAVAPATEPAGYEQQVAELVDLDVLVARGLDISRLRFVPVPSDSLFGYARCPVRGCGNVTEHTPTSLCRPLPAPLRPLAARQRRRRP